MAKLIFSGDKFGGRVYEITAQRTTVGRGDANTLSIHDSSVSEQHCEIYDNGEDLIIRDLGSRNGTVVNGALLQNAQGPLAHGQIVKFGAVEARLEIPRHATNSDTVTDVTAVHFHAHKAGAQPPASNPAAILDTGKTPAPDDHTMILPRLSSPPPVAPAAPPPTPAPQASRVWLYILAPLGLALLLWLILR